MTGTPPGRDPPGVEEARTDESGTDEPGADELGGDESGADTPETSVVPGAPPIRPLPGQPVASVDDAMAAPDLPTRRAAGPDDPTQLELPAISAAVQQIDPVDAPEPPTRRGAGGPELGAAICQRCGGGKRGPFVPCKSCGFTPSGSERQVAWLLSEHHLDPVELEEAARRIREGERPDPPRSLLEQARVEMGAAPLSDLAMQPLSTAQLLGLTAANLLVTPLSGLAIWWGLRAERPIAARQTLRMTVPVMVGLALVWGGLMAKWTLG